MNKPIKSPDRFTVELIALVKAAYGIVMDLNSNRCIDRSYLIRVLENATQNASRVSYDFPLHCKELAAISNSNLSIKDSRVVLKGILGYTGEHPDQTKFDGVDIPRLKACIFRNSGRYTVIAQALKNWK